MPLTIQSYNFDASAGIVTFTAYPSIVKESIDLITNTTAGIVIYTPNDSSKDASVINNTVILSYNTSSMNDTDTLQILYTPSSTSAKQKEINEISELSLSWKSSYDVYTEFTTVDNEITQINYWSDNTKLKKLFTKDITYTNGNPTVITIKDEITNKILTTTIVYSGDEVLNITKTIS